MRPRLTFACRDKKGPISSMTRKAGREPSGVQLGRLGRQHQSVPLQPMQGCLQGPPSYTSSCSPMVATFALSNGPVALWALSCIWTVLPRLTQCQASYRPTDEQAPNQKGIGFGLAQQLPIGHGQSQRSAERYSILAAGIHFSAVTVRSASSVSAYDISSVPHNVDGLEQARLPLQSMSIDLRQHDLLDLLNVSLTACSDKDVIDIHQTSCLTSRVHGSTRQYQPQMVRFPLESAPQLPGCARPFGAGLLQSVQSLVKVAALVRSIVLVVGLLLNVSSSRLPFGKALLMSS